MFFFENFPIFPQFFLNFPRSILPFLIQLFIVDNLRNGKSYSQTDFTIVFLAKSQAEMTPRSSQQLFRSSFYANFRKYAHFRPKFSKMHQNHTETFSRGFSMMENTMQLFKKYFENDLQISEISKISTKYANF